MKVSIPHTWNKETVKEAFEVRNKTDEANDIEEDIKAGRIIEDEGDIPEWEDKEEFWHFRSEYFDMLPEWAKDIPELEYVCQHTSPENVAEEFKHFIAFNGQMNSRSHNKNIKAELIEGMFRRLNVTPDQIRKAIFEELIEWS